MCNQIRKRDEEVIWFFGATSYAIPILFSRLLGRTVVVQPRGDVPLTLEIYWSKILPSPLARLLSNSLRFLEKMSYSLADAIVTYTPSMADELGLKKYSGKLYPNGARYIRTDRFYPRVPYEERENIVGFLGRLDEEKRIRELAEVAERLPDDIKFVFAGDGDLKRWLEQELSEEIESDDVEMTGWVERDEVPEVLSSFKLLVLPSQPTEGLPTVILESYACGTPVYATPVSGVPDVVCEGETGFLIKDICPDRLAREIERIFDEEDLAEMSQRCQELVEEEYSLEAAVERYEKILSRI
jgi:glycosyltransferase involved in cell wall biosynthesis